MIFAVTVESWILAPVVSFIPVFASFALNFISIQLEDPFGQDANDLPMHEFQAEMNNCLMMLLHTNTDIIPGISERCIMQFDDLRASMPSLRVRSRASSHRRKRSDRQHSPERKGVRKSGNLFSPDFDMREVTASQ